MVEPDHSQVDAALAAYEAAVQTQTDNDAATIAKQKQQIGDLQNQVADLQNQIQVSQPVKTIEFSDFSQNGGNAGQFWGNTDVVGTGADRSKTVYRMKPKTSTKASQVPAQSTNKTNPYRLIRTAGANASAKTNGREYANFTLEGTEQAHLYGGLNIQYSDKAHVHDVAVTGIPGDAASPPGETFSLALWHADNALVENVLLDGKRAADGQMVAATLFGLNTVLNCTVRKLVAQNAIYGMGVAVWDSSGTFTFDDCDFSYCRRPINFEQGHDGLKATFNRPNLSKQRDTSGPVISFRSTLGRNQLFIVDPITDRWPIKVYTPAKGTTDASRGTNTVDRADIHLIIGGKDVSGDKTKLLIG